MNIIYAGTPEFAVAPLLALLQSRHQVVAVYTQPDRPAGRGRKLTASPVKQAARQNDLPVEQPSSLRDSAALERLASHGADLMVVAAYGLILPPQVLQTPRLGCVNIHASLLPRWRGAAPIQRAILAGDTESGVTLMQMDEGLDTGPMLAKTRVAIGPRTTAAELHNRLSEAGAGLLLQHIDAIEQQALVAEPQNAEQATYADKLTKQEARIDWSLPAHQLERQVRAYNPWPVSHSTLDGEPVKIWAASVLDTDCESSPGTVVDHSRQGLDVCCGESMLRISCLQLAGRKAQSTDDLLNARSLAGRIFV